MTSVKQVVLPCLGDSNAKLNLGLPDLGSSDLGSSDLGSSDLGSSEKSINSKSSIHSAPRLEPPPIEPPCESWLPNQSIAHLGLMAGTALTLAAGITAIAAQHAQPPAPQYEGSFQIRLEASPTQPAAKPLPLSRSIAAPEVFSEGELRLLQSPKLLYPILAQTPGLNYETLTQNLKVTVNTDDQLDVHYRDADAQRLQSVLQQLAQAYLHYSKECEADACRGVSFIQEKMPIVEAQIADLQAQMQQIDRQNGVEDITAQTQLFEARSTELAQQKADIDVQLVHVVDQFDALQQQLGLSQDEAIAVTLLGQDANYQQLLPRLQEIDRQIATELSQFQVSSPNLQGLYAQHEEVQQQLYQVAQGTLRRYLARPDANTDSPVFQEPHLLELLQQSIESAHYLRVLQIRQETIAQTDDLVKQQCDKLAGLLRQHDTLQQQLDSKTQILQIYQDRLMALRHSIDVSAAPPIWQLATQPHLVSSDGFHMPQFLLLEPEMNQLNELNALIRTLLGVGTAIVVGAATQRKKRWDGTGVTAEAIALVATSA